MSTTRRVRPPDHRCKLPAGEPGEVVVCEECGRVWSRDYGDPLRGRWMPVPRWWARLRGWLR